MDGFDGKVSMETHPLNSSPFIGWQPLAVAFWKLNSDTTWNPITKLGDLGRVVRDHLGQVHIVGSKFILRCCEVNVLEAMIICLGLESNFHNP